MNQLPDFAKRAYGLTSSKVRELFDVVSNPKAISLAGGMPFIPADLALGFEQSISRVLKSRADVALQYGPGRGIVKLREQIADLMQEEGVPAKTDDFVITTGSQSALELIGKIFLNPGDTVLCEAPTYLTAILVFISFEAQIEQVKADTNGMDPEEFEQKILQLKAGGKKPKLLYTVPNFNNPSGYTLSAQRRVRVLEIAQKHGIIIVEDNPYGRLYFDKKPPLPIKSLSNDVIYMGTFSKFLAPGFRVGWVSAIPAIRDKLILANETAVLAPSTFSQMAISQYLSDHNLSEYVGRMRGLYAQKRDSLIRALKKHLPGFGYETPEGGFFVWAKLPEGICSEKLLQKAIERLVAFVPGGAFYTEEKFGRRYARLSFCLPPVDQFEEGVLRLKGALEAV